MNEDNLLNKWLANDLSDAERKAFEESEDYELNMKISEHARYFKAPPFSQEKAYAELKAKLGSKNTPVRKLQFYKILYKIAAVFILGLAISFFFLFNSTNTVETLASQKITFELPDASSVTLNAVSKISYSKYRWKNNRKVKLEGEAFFKVAKGSRFDVLTTDGIVSVVGTQFNVKDRGNCFEVECFEGIVNVNANGELHRLTYGKTFRMINNLVVLDSTFSTEPAWLGNKSNFKSIPLYEVLNEIERQYNIRITTLNIDTNRLYTGGFVHDNLEQALISIALPFNLNYTIESSNKAALYPSE